MPSPKFPSKELSTLAKELTAFTRLIQSSSNEFSTPLSGNAKNVSKRKPIHDVL